MSLGQHGSDPRGPIERKQAGGDDQLDSGVLFIPTFLKGTSFTNAAHQDVTTYLINPKFKITNTSMVYVRVASGYRPGGPDYVIPPPFPAGTSPIHC